MTAGSRLPEPAPRYTATGPRADEVEIGRLVIAGYTGRDPDRVQAHIDELASQGIAPPPQVPMFWEVDPGLFQVTDRLEVDHDETSGEVEGVLVVLDSGLFVGVGSDHTDRRLERHDVGASKMACSKVVAPSLVPFEELAASWESVRLRSWTGRDRKPYQDGLLGLIRDPRELVDMIDPSVEAGTAIFLGTVPTLDGHLAMEDHFEFELSVGGTTYASWSYAIERGTGAIG